MELSPSNFFEQCNTRRVGFCIVSLGLCVICTSKTSFFINVNGKSISFFHKEKGGANIGSLRPGRLK
jgi:hypothetical protein